MLRKYILVVEIVLFLKVACLLLCIAVCYEFCSAIFWNLFPHRLAANLEAFNNMKMLEFKFDVEWFSRNIMTTGYCHGWTYKLSPGNQLMILCL